jgi:hypothetical protein
MRKPFLRFAFIWAAMAIIAMAMPSCKGGVKDADIEKAVTAAAASAGTITATVKDGVVTLNGMFKDDAGKTAFEATVKAIAGVKSVVDNATITPPPPAPAPVVITADDPLIKAVTDATKDFPGVKADVKDGVITLTGEIKRASLQKLIMSLNTLKPKKIDNQLTIK